MGLWRSFFHWFFRASRPTETPTLTRTEVPRVPPRFEPTPVIVGLDFGTYSTKVLIRPRGQPSAEIVRIEPAVEGYPWFAAPSLVRVVSGNVFFGGKTLATPGGTLYRSLKVQLLPPSEGNLPHNQFPSGPEPDLLVAGYLSWVLQSVKREIDERHKYGSPRVFLNVAAPMNHFEHAQLKTRYLQIIQAAWESLFGDRAFPAEQGMCLKDLEARLFPWIDRAVPDPAVRAYEALPETLAPIVSLSLDPRMAPGMYMIVDMGAGTTEMSVDHVSHRGADQKIACYYDESKVFGGDDFSRVKQRFPDATETRNQKEEELVRRFLKFFKRTWAKGYAKDAPNHAARGRWRQLTVLLTGGGARHAKIDRAIRHNRPMYAWPARDTEYRVAWHQPMGIDVRRQNDSGLGVDGHLLSVAHGLSLPRQQWPDFFSPGEIEEQHATEVIEKPAGHWYAER